MKKLKRCHWCGRRAPVSKEQEKTSKAYGGDGWLSADEKHCAQEMGTYYYTEIVRGDDPSILCPKCLAEKCVDCGGGGASPRGYDNETLLCDACWIKRALVEKAEA